MGLLMAASLRAQEAGWHYSALPGEGDRATMGCDRDASPAAFSCLVVRCEDDFSTGVYVHTSRVEDSGRWEMTLDRENRSPVAEATAAPYGARFGSDAGWLLERLEQGSFVYLRHSDDTNEPFRYISLSGSLYAVNHALAWCAPRAPAAEQIPAPDVTPVEP